MSMLEHCLPIQSNLVYDEFYGMGFYSGRSFGWRHLERCSTGECRCLEYVNERITALPTLDDERAFMRTVGFLAGWASGRDTARAWPNLNLETTTV